MQLVRTEMGLQVRSGGVPADREIPAPAYQARVCSHPRGGWTIATRSSGGAAWIYHGNFSTHDQAARILSARPDLS